MNMVENGILAPHEWGIVTPFSTTRTVEADNPLTQFT